MQVFVFTLPRLKIIPTHQDTICITSKAEHEVVQFAICHDPVHFPRLRISNIFILEVKKLNSKEKNLKR